VQLRAFGTFSFRVTDGAKFFREFAGTDSEVTTDELLEQFRSRLVSEFGSELKASGKSLQEINANVGALGEALLPKLQADFAAVGTELLRFNIEALTLPDEIQKALTDQDLEIRKIRRAGTAQIDVDMQRRLQEQTLELQRLKQQAELSKSVEDMQRFIQFQSGVAMEYSGKNPGGEGGNLLNQMMQMGIGMNLAGQMSGQLAGGASASSGSATKSMSKDEIMSALKEIGQLKEAGILTQEEFDAKKKELLARL
jgi:membrane protease subunit (stomatin/prohibitin family)